MSKADFPQTVAALARKRASFEAWLTARGSQVMPLTNAYEVMRFTTPKGVGLIFRNKGDTLSSWRNGAYEAYSAFVSAGPWHVGQRVKRTSKSERLVLALIERDGSDCMYCGEAMDEASMTLEHILSVAHGGTNHLSNLSLACRTCNAAMGHLCVRQKFERALRLRCAAIVREGAE